MKLLITCSNTRINSNLISQLYHEKLFIIRNAGNIILENGKSFGCGEAAMLELAVEHLGVTEISVCGHTDCRAMKELMQHPASWSKPMPSVQSWLSHAMKTKALVDDRCELFGIQERLSAAEETNVMVQLEHLQSYPAVSKQLASGQLTLQGLIYDIETGDVRPTTQQSPSFKKFMGERRASE